MIRKIFFCLLAMFATFAMAQQKQLLRFHPTVGDTTKYSTSTITKVYGKNREPLTMEYGLSMNVVCVERVKDVSKMEYSLGTPSAKVSGVEMPLPKDASQRFSNLRITAEIGELGGQIGKAIISEKGSLNSFSSNFSEGFLGTNNLPKEAVGVGDSWKVKTAFLGLELEALCKVVSLTDKVCRMEIEVDIPWNAKDAKGQKIEMYGSIRSHVSIDIATGMAVPGTVETRSEFFTKEKKDGQPFKTVSIMKM